MTALAAGVIASIGFAGRAEAATVVDLKVGIPQAGSFSFVPLTIGKQVGLFKKHNVNIHIETFASTDRLDPALAKGTVQIAMGSGTELAFNPGRAPDTAVATLPVKPSELVVTARPDSGIKTVGDLKGQSVGVSAADGLPAWLVRTLSKSRGWGANGITLQPLKRPLVTDNKINPAVKSIVTGLHTAVDLADHGQGHTVVNVGDVVKSFPLYVAFARNDLVQQKPKVVTNVLAAMAPSYGLITVAEVTAARKESPPFTTSLPVMRSPCVPKSSITALGCSRDGRRV